MNTLAATCKNNNNKKVKKNCHAIDGTNNTSYTTPYIMTICQRAAEAKGLSGLLQYTNLVTHFYKVTVSFIELSLFDKIYNNN